MDIEIDGTINDDQIEQMDEETVLAWLHRPDYFSLISNQ